MLKKLLFVMVAALGIMTAAAQEAVIVKPAVFDNMYVSATVGANTEATAFCENLYPELNVYVGKWFTPNVGVELNGEMDLWDSFKTRSCFVKQSYVGIAGMVNLSNLFGGYKHHVVDVIPFVGAGWLHGYVNRDGDTNDIATKMGVNVQFNVSNSVGINVRPNIMYNLTANDYPKYNVNRALVGLELGVTYNFPAKFRTKEVVDYATFAALNDEVNALRARQPEIVYVTNTVTETVTNTVAEVVPPTTNVGFTINSSKIAYTQMAGIATVADYLNQNPDATVKVYGYADALTGTPEYNMGLSERRAEAVKAALVDLGVAADRIQVRAEGSCTQIYGTNDWNRAAVIKINE